MPKLSATSFLAVIFDEKVGLSAGLPPDDAPALRDLYAQDKWGAYQKVLKSISAVPVWQPPPGLLSFAEDILRIILSYLDRATILGPLYGTCRAAGGLVVPTVRKTLILPVKSVLWDDSCPFSTWWKSAKSMELYGFCVQEVRKTMHADFPDSLPHVTSIEIIHKAGKDAPMPTAAEFPNLEELYCADRDRTASFRDILKRSPSVKLFASASRLSEDPRWGVVPSANELRPYWRFVEWCQVTKDEARWPRPFRIPRGVESITAARVSNSEGVSVVTMPWPSEDEAAGICAVATPKSLCDILMDAAVSGRRLLHVESWGECGLPRFVIIRRAPPVKHRQDLASDLDIRCELVRDMMSGQYDEAYELDAALNRCIRFERRQSPFEILRRAEVCSALASSGYGPFQVDLFQAWSPVSKTCDHHKAIGAVRRPPPRFPSREETRRLPRTHGLASSWFAERCQCDLSWKILMNPRSDLPSEYLRSPPETAGPERRQFEDYTPWQVSRNRPGVCPSWTLLDPFT